MTPPAAAASAIVSHTHPSSLQETVHALETLKQGGQDNNQGNVSSKVVFWKGGPSSKHHLPLETMEPPGCTKPESEEKPFLATPYNRFLSIDKKRVVYQSPWTSKCYHGSGKTAEVDLAETHNHKNNQEAAAGANPIQQEIHTLEKAANEVWDSYRQLYYGYDSVGSVFVRQRGTPNGEAATATDATALVLEAFFGVHKDAADDGARWDSVHLVTVQPPNMETRMCEYKIESSVWCNLEQRPPTASTTAKSDGSLSTSLSATLTKETVKTCKLEGILPPKNLSSRTIPTAAHIENVGTLLEQIEMDFRSQLERVAMPKAVEVMQGIYREPGKSATVHLMSDDANGSSTSTGSASGTGMGVGKDMIGDIADSAKSKDSDKVVETMAQKKQQDKERAAATSSNGSQAVNDYANVKASLKKSSIMVTPTDSTKASVNSATPEFVNFRDKLKSPTKK
jgi:hypothetical protein